MTKANWTIMFLLAVFLLSSPSCGKKGAPFIPKKEFHLGVIGLAGEWSEGFFHLWGDINGPDNSKEARAAILGCRVYYAEFPADNPPCADCPIKYQGYHAFGPEVVKGARFSCMVPGKTEREVTFFKVYLVGPEGAMGPPSNSIEMTPKQ